MEVYCGTLVPEFGKTEQVDGFRSIDQWHKLSPSPASNDVLNLGLHVVTVKLPGLLVAGHQLDPHHV